MMFLDAPVTPPLGKLYIAWSEESGLHIWNEPGGEPLRVRDLLLIAAMAIAFGIAA